jgi:hypothetical protein
LTNQLGEDIIGLLVASDELLLEELFDHVQDYLIKEHNGWVYENFVLVLHAVFNLDNCKRLRDYCLESICENPLQFFISETFPSINKEILFGLLKRDDLQIEEVIVWDYLIKWGIEQTSGLGSNRAEWNRKNYRALKTTLKKFIPLIRFVEISRADFFDKVRPYKAIIPTYIYEEIEEFYYKDTLPKTTILPPRTNIPTRTGNFRSNIIKPRLANIIANWIDEKDAMFARTSNCPLYEFTLIYRGSRDGINNESFKYKCNGGIASLVLIKDRQSSKIFGGYSSIGLSSLDDACLIDIDNDVRFYYSSNNFIFSFESSEDIQNMKIGRVINNSEAMLEYSGHGFNFGWGSFGMIDQTFQVNNRYNYENILDDIEISGTIEEIETFIVTQQ